MDGCGEENAGPKRALMRNAFSCAFYLFGMVITAPVFTFFALRALDPTRRGLFAQGSVDPVLSFLVLPAAGAVVGFVLVLLANVVYALRRGR